MVNDKCFFKLFENFIGYTIVWGTVNLNEHSGFDI